MNYQVMSAIVMSARVTIAFLASQKYRLHHTFSQTKATLSSTVQAHSRILLLLVVLPLCALFSTLHVGAQDQIIAQSNSTIPGTIRVIKQTMPASQLRFSFALRRSGSILHRFKLRNGGRKTFTGLEAGHGYRLTETVPEGWAQSSATCNNGSNITNIHVVENRTVVCTFVNVQLGKLIVKQVTVPANDTNTTFALTASGGLSPTSFNLGNGETRTFSNLMPGTNYRLSEAALPGWALSSATCSNGSSVDRVTVEPGQTVTCTFTATQLGKLTVRKVTTPNPDLTDQQFTFTAGGGLTPVAFTLKNTQVQTFANLTPKSGYTLVEQDSANWRLASALCDNNSSPSNIRIDPGQTVTCTFHNEATAVNLTLAMTDSDVTAEAGDTIVYTLRYHNSGNQDATNAFIVTTVPQFTTFVGPINRWNCAVGAPAGTQCTYTIGTLSGGVTEGQVQLKVRVDKTLPANATTVNSSATLGYSALANAAQSSETTPLKTVVGLNLQKDDDGLTARADSLITYTLTYGNNGTQTATAVAISETVPANTTFVGPTDQWSCPPGSAAGATCIHPVGTLAAHDGNALSFIVKVNSSLPSGLEAIENVAAIGSDVQPNSDFGSERTELIAAPDLLVHVNDGGIAVSPGGTLHYRVSYANQGTQAADGVYLTATVPPHTQFNGAESNNGWQCANTICQLAVGTLVSGGSSVVDLALTVDRPVPADVNAVTLAVRVDDNGQNGVDTNKANNSASIQTTIVAPTDFSATKQDSLAIDLDHDGLASAGDTIEYTIVLRNDSGANVRQLVVTDPLDANLRLTGTVSTDHGIVVEGNNANDRRVVVQVGDLPGAGATATIRFRAVVRTPLPADVDFVQNQAMISSQDFSSRLTDDPDTASRRDATVTELDTTVALQATLRDTLLIDADNNGKITVGDTIIYNLSVQNSGDVDAGALSVIVPLDPNVELVPGTVNTSSGDVVEGDDDERQVELALDTLAAAATIQASFQVKITKQTTSISHQAAIVLDSVSGQSAVNSDDPDTATPGDATVTPVDSVIPTVDYQLYLPVVQR